jgi:hypothetical protein
MIEHQQALGLQLGTVSNIRLADMLDHPRSTPQPDTRAESPNSVPLLLLAPGRGEVALLAVFKGKDLESLAFVQAMQTLVKSFPFKLGCMRQFFDLS